MTERARLGVSVLIATVRPAALLAKQVATLDSLSEGRTVMGFGVGWQEAEYTATNMPFDARFGRMEETVAACRELWTNAPATFQGRDFAFENYHSLPLPIQPRIPVLFGFGPSRRNFDRIARVADGWTVNPTDLGTTSPTVLHCCATRSKPTNVTRSRRACKCLRRRFDATTGPSTSRQPQTRPGTGSPAARPSSFSDPPYSIALPKNYQNYSTG